MNHNDQGGFKLVGPLFCSWKGGSNCDARTAQDIDLGVAPFYFYGQNVKTKYEIIPPLLHYYRYNDRDLSWTNVWGPYFRRHTQKLDMFHLFPLYYSLWGSNERHTTLLPFFHYGHKGNSGCSRRRCSWQLTAKRERTRSPPGSMRGTAGEPSSTWSRPCTGRIAIRTLA